VTTPYRSCTSLGVRVGGSLDGVNGTRFQQSTADRRGFRLGSDIWNPLKVLVVHINTGLFREV
jgi:hypothetical protein